MFTAQTAHGPVARAHAFALEQPVARVAKIVFAGIAIMAVLGTFERLGWGFSLFDFDGEGNPSAAWSALVLLATAATTALVALEHEHGRRFLALGVFFTFMGLDEMLTIHESSSEVAGIGWITLWAPLVLIGAIAWLLVLQRIWPFARERALFVGGAALWFLSQVLEQVQSNPEEGRVDGYGALSAFEEVFEVTGTALFLLAMLGTLQLLAARRRAT